MIKRCFLRLLAVVLGLGLVTSAKMSRAAQADPEALMMALNMAAVSVRHITAASDRLVLDQEYAQVVNNLKVGSLGDSPELMNVYTRLLDAISACRLNDEERAVFAGIYEHRQKNALLTVLADQRLSAGTLRHFFASLFSCGVNAYFGVRRELADIHRAGGEKNWQLQKDSLQALNNLQKELLSGSWLLLQRFGLSDEWRIAQDDLDSLEQTMQQNDWNKAAPMYALLEKSFSRYPPYWFYRADAAYRGGDAHTALVCLDEYDRRWKPVLRRDPCRAQAARLRILLDETMSDEQVLALLDRIEANTGPRDWLDALFCGTILWALGKRDEAKAAVRANLLFSAETEVSTVVLEHMERGDFDRASFCNDLTSALTGDTAAAAGGELLAAWLDGHDQLANKLACERLRGEPAALPACLLWLQSREGKIYAPARSAACEERFEQLKDDDAEAEGALAACRLRAAQGSPRARLLLAVAAERGWGGGKDPFAAARWYKAAAESGNTLAQDRYAALCASGEGTRRDSAESVRWYQAAAAGGSVEAHYQLGRLHRTGQGAMRDLAAAAEHFLAAAKAGHAGAQAALGELYSKGAGVPQDWFEAYKWSTAAVLNGASGAKKTLNIVEGHGALRRRRLSPDEIERARAEGRALWERTAAH